MIQRYETFVAEIFSIEPWRLKYLDESTFDPRKFKRKAWQRKNQKRQIPINRNLSSKSVTVTLLTSIDRRDDGVTIDVRVGTNDRYDFLKFILYCATKGVLCRGDVLVLDNASVHHAKDIHEYFLWILNEIGCFLLYMPTYSPELNPCELVFAQTKKHVSRLWSTSNLNLENCVLVSFATVTKTNIINYYRYCRYLKFRK